MEGPNNSRNPPNNLRGATRILTGGLENDEPSKIAPNNNNNINNNNVNDFSITNNNSAIETPATSISALSAILNNVSIDHQQQQTQDLASTQANARYNNKSSSLANQKNVTQNNQSNDDLGIFITGAGLEQHSQNSRSSQKQTSTHLSNPINPATIVTLNNNYNYNSNNDTDTEIPQQQLTTSNTVYNIKPSSSSTSSSSSSSNSNALVYRQQIQHQHHQQQHHLPLPRDASSSGSNLTLNSSQILTSEIKSLFECPICFDYATPPIYQCQNGHLVCNACSIKINQCATCRVPISMPSIRNLQLDRLANTFQFPCKYNFNGCQWKSYWFKKKDHEDDCEFVSYPCPCPGTNCKWSGLLSQVMNHLREHHKSITTLSGEDIVFLATAINLKGAVDWVMIQSCFNHHFLLVLEKQEFKFGQLFFAVVQLIGSQKEAEKFKYKLELGGTTSGHVRRLQWESRTNSCLEGIQPAISNHDCLVFDGRMAKHFLTHFQKDNNNSHQNNSENHDENLAINVTIEEYTPNNS